MGFIPHQGPQEYLLGSRAIPEVFFGGARGGGKTATLLGDFEQDAHTSKHWSGLFLRRTYPELEEVIQQSYRFFTASGATFKATTKTWIWPSGARLKMRSLERSVDASKFQGHEYTWIGWDELTNWATPDAFEALIGCLRTSGSVGYARIRASGNPGGPGHQWVKSRYQLGALNAGYRVIEQPVSGLHRMYIPSLTSDNPSLMQNSPNYIRQLRAVGSPELVRAWLFGDWDIVLGSYYPEWSEAEHVIDDIDLHELPRGWQVYRAYDHGSYHPFCVLWYTIAGHAMPGIKKGSIIILREWYGGDDDGKGLKMSLHEIGQGIVDREASFGRKVSDGPADNQIYEEDGGRPMADILAQYGVYFCRSDKRRLPGWNQLRARLQQRSVRVCRSCKFTRLTLPLLQHDETRKEDVDTTGNDHCFVGETLVDTPNGPTAISLLPVQGVVWTPAGWREYDRAGLKQRNVDVVRVVFSDGSEATCTPDHQFLVEEQGWEEARNLVDKICVKVAPSPLKQSMPQPKNLTELDTICAENTSSATGLGYTVPYGSITTGLSPRAFTSITRTKVGKIISSGTSNCYQQVSIFRGICRPLNEEKGLGKPSRKLLQPLQNGTGASRGETGTEGTITKGRGSCFMRKLKSLAKAVVSAFKADSMRSFAATIAKQSTDESLGSITRREDVLSAQPYLSSINTRSNSPAQQSAVQSAQTESVVRCVSVEPAGKADVYCLRVPSAKCFTINGGMVVHNCADVVRYICMRYPINPIEPTNPVEARGAMTYDELMSAIDKTVRERI